MYTPFAKSVLALLILLSPLTSAAATPEEETRFVDAVKKVFSEKEPADLAKLSCWDGVSDKDRKKQEEGYKAVVEQKDVTFRIKLVEIDPKFPVKEHKEDGVPMRPNLKIIKQVDVTLIDDRDKKILMVIGFAVGEKDGKLLLVNDVPAK